MTDFVPEERRRYPRQAPAHAARLSVPAVHDVEVLDISQSGILFWCRAPLHVGQRAQIRTVLDRDPFTASIEIVRMERDLHYTRNRQYFGARFVAIDETSQRNLQRFLVLGR